MSSRLPVVPIICVSIVLEHHIDVVWRAVQLHNFERWYEPVAKSYKLIDQDSERDVVRWEFDEKMDNHTVDFEGVAKDGSNFISKH